MTDERPATGPGPHVNDVARPDLKVEHVRRCALCGEASLETLFEAKDELHGFAGTWGVVRCRRCGLMLTSPRPTRTAISSFYPDDYQPFTAPHAPSPEGWRRSVKALVSRLLDPKEHVLPKGIPPGDALEVGCGSGRYLVQLAAAGWNVRGLEPSAPTAASLCEQIGLPVTVGTIESVLFEPASFDLVAAYMVLEHLHSPLDDLRKLYGWLRPGGFLTGSVPNCGSWEFKVLKERWYALQVPTHLFHYTPQTLTRLLTTAGFRDVRIFHQRNVSNLVVHVGMFLDRHRLPGAQTCLSYPESGSRLMRYSLRPVASLLAWLRQTGRITFIARRGPQEAGDHDGTMGARRLRHDVEQLEDSLRNAERRAGHV